MYIYVALRFQTAILWLFVYLALQVTSLKTKKMSDHNHSHDHSSDNESRHHDEGTALRFVLYGFLGILLLIGLRLLFKIFRDYITSKLQSKQPNFEKAKSTSHTISPSNSGGALPSTPTKPASRAVGLSGMPLYFKV